MTTAASNISRWYGVLGVAVLLFLAGCRVDDDVMTLKLAHGLPNTHPVHLGMEYMGERLVEKSGGEMRMEIYPSEQLGSERQTLELLQIGSLDVTKVSASLMEGFVSSFRLFGLPFLFEDESHLHRVLESDVGRELLLEGESKRFRGLTYYDAGGRSFYTTSRPVNTPADLRGLKIRTQESVMAFQMVRALGASATPVSWGELYTALQQGLVDGAENNPPSFHLSRHYEVARYYTLNEHTFVPDVLVIGTNTWQKLTEEQRRWVQEAADESAIFQRVAWREAEEAALAAVEAAGVTIIRPDKEPFMREVAGLYASLRNDPLYELIERVRAIE
jgi:tripartite ATP-independent transporter DctP family solute receptor